jgi:hypothetical protein
MSAGKVCHGEVETETSTDLRELTELRRLAPNRIGVDGDDGLPAQPGAHRGVPFQELAARAFDRIIDTYSRPGAGRPRVESVAGIGIGRVVNGSSWNPDFPCGRSGMKGARINRKVSETQVAPGCPARGRNSAVPLAVKG